MQSPRPESRAVRWLKNGFSLSIALVILSASAKILFGSGVSSERLSRACDRLTKIETLDLPRNDSSHARIEGQLGQMKDSLLVTLTEIRTELRILRGSGRGPSR